MITAERLRELLHYDPETGVFTRLSCRCHSELLGQPAGCLDSKGYIRIRVDGRKYRAHRLAWLYMTGFWPEDDVDHKDVDPSNNRWANLRKATKAQNTRNSRRPANNTSGYKGASWNIAAQKWVGTIGHNGEKIYLGCFDTPEAAHAAYCAAAQRLHGAFARTA